MEPKMECLPSLAGVSNFENLEMKKLNVRKIFGHIEN